MSTVRLNTVSTVDAICAMLEDDIYSLHYPPGARISEKDLTNRYGVSRNTVREAIAFFLSNGLLEKVAMPVPPPMFNITKGMPKNELMA